MDKFKFDPGGFMICKSRRFMFVVIAKNASTSLKRLVHSLDYPGQEPLFDTEAIHEFFGYSLDGKTRIPLISNERPATHEYTRFAVYRDPVERFLSVYNDKVSPARSAGKAVRKYFASCGVIDSDIDTFLCFTENELQKSDPLLQDEHLRPQSSFYEPENVDWVVPIESLDSFLMKHLDIDTGSRYNKSGQTTHLTEAQLNILNTLYKDDYDILKAENFYKP